MIINRFFYAPPAPVYTVSTLASSLVAKSGSDAAASNYLSTVAAYNNGSFNGGGADNTAFNSAYNAYVSTLPGGGFGRDGASDTTGYLLWYPSGPMTVSLSSASAGSCSLAGDVVTFNVTDFVRVNVYVTSPISFPVTGTYIPANSFSSTAANSYPSTFDSGISGNGTVKSSGDSYYNQSVNGWFYSVLCTSATFGTSSFLYKYKVVPSDSSVVTTSYPTSSRVNTVINNYAVKNENNTYNYITNKPIFDEDTLVFYNPLTGVSFNVTGWYYDYSTRRYVLTYTDNSVSKTATAEYGDNYITVTADGASSNYYYIA